MTLPLKTAMFVLATAPFRILELTFEVGRERAVAGNPFAYFAEACPLFLAPTSGNALFSVAASSDDPHKSVLYSAGPINPTAGHFLHKEPHQM